MFCLAVPSATEDTVKRETLVGENLGELQAKLYLAK